jgi:hypothetical protein
MKQPCPRLGTTRQTTKNKCLRILKSQFIQGSWLLSRELLAVARQPPCDVRTPLQIEQHLTLAFEAAYLFGEKPITTAIIESVLSKQIDDLEPTLTRHGYDVRGLAEQFNAKPAEIKLLFRGQLDPARSRELQEQMLAAGLPL